MSARTVENNDMSSNTAFGIPRIDDSQTGPTYDSIPNSSDREITKLPRVTADQLLFAIWPSLRPDHTATIVTHDINVSSGSESLYSRQHYVIFGVFRVLDCAK